jgi:transposase
MRQLKEVLRLRFEAKLSHSQIAGSCRVSKGVVSKYLKRAQRAGVGWPLPEGMSEAELEHRLYPASLGERRARFAEPDFKVVHLELKRKGVTLQLLWEEYQQAHPDDGYSYSQFCARYQRWRGQQRRSMRQVHKAGEKLFIDYCGPTVAVIDAHTGEVRAAQVFVAVLGASNYTFAEATWTQSLPDWIGSHVRAFGFFQGVTELLVIDNLKSGVTHPCRYDPETNPTYAELAAHYGTAVLPARPYKPKDKAKAEAAVQLVERWILARLRHRTFFSLGELNEAIRALLADLNDRPFQKLLGSRRSAFEALDRPALKPLPPRPYAYAEWKKATPGIDYHVEVKHHFYSVPHVLVGKALDVRFTAHTVEVFHKHERVASHVRDFRGGFTTVAEHMPKAHRAHGGWTPGRFLNWAQQIGPYTLRLVKHQLETRPHPEHGYRACLGLRHHARRVGPQRLEAACRRALSIGSPSARSVASILKQGLDRQPLADHDETAGVLPQHDNVRGPRYYC